MPEDVTTCPNCGEPSRDPEWCDHCGTRLATPSEGAEEWLEKGAKVELLDHDEQRLTVEIEASVDTFATRRVLFGRVSDGPDEAVGMRLLVEETEENETRSNTIPDELDHLFRTPLAVGRHGDHAVHAHEDTGALTLEDLVDLGGGAISYNQVKETFLAILDAVNGAHEQRHLILTIAPWTIRLENLAGVDEMAAESSARWEERLGDGDVTVESQLPDKAVLEEASAAAEAEIERERAARESESAVGTELSDAEDAEDAEEVEPDATPGFDETEKTAETDEVILDLRADEEEAGLSRETTPGHTSTPTSDASASDEGNGETTGEKGEAPDDDVREEADVDDGWGALEDDGDALGDTGVLHVGPAEEKSGETKAYFEGIDELFPFDEEPAEYPVIMGFSPPELLGRVRADLGPHCDVFALGMLLYYMIAGRVPPASVYTRYTPALPSRNFRPGFPPGLQPIVSRATRPNPGDRFASVKAMKDAFLGACELMERRSEHVGGSDAPRARIAVDTHVGIAKGKRNPVNQDSVFGRVSDDGRFALMVIADGVSTASYGSGDLASNFLTKTAEEVWAEVLPQYLMEERVEEVKIIARILEEANRRIVDHVNANFQPFDGNPHEVMGTTALICVLREGIVTLASLGDSRVYLQTSGGLEQITADHNLWTLSVLDGITADAALSMPHGDALARCLGTFVIDDQRLTAVRPEADYFRFSIAHGDTLLLTTDGLIDFAGANPIAAEENVLAVMLAEPDPALACLELILLANRGGGGDNVGVGIAHFV